VRAYAYPASIVPILLGGVYARHETGWLLPGHLLLALAAGMLYHTGCNLLNDYYDYRYGVDRPGAFGGNGLLVSGMMTPRQIALGAWASLAVGSLIGFYFVCRYGLPVLVIGIAGFLGAVFYTATPYGLKYHALGEPLVFLRMGVGMVLGGFATQGAGVSARACAASLPVAFLVAAILQANDTRDIAGDRESGVTTLSVILGPGARGFSTSSCSPRRTSRSRRSRRGGSCRACRSSPCSACRWRGESLRDSRRSPTRTMRGSRRPRGIRPCSTSSSGC
jgi:1,4-dihydroxy-2-naphthoate polyprenyltransferase